MGGFGWDVLVPVIMWATGVIFLAGGVWFEIRSVRKALSRLEPLMEKVPVIEERVDKAEGEIERLRDWRNQQAAHIAQAGD